MVEYMQTLGWISIALTAIFYTILLPQSRRKIRVSLNSDNVYIRGFAKYMHVLYETQLHNLVSTRQVLFFLLPTACLVVLFPPASWEPEHFLGSLVLGLSILIFVTMQLPSLMKAQLHIAFRIDGKYARTIKLESGKTHKVECEIQNLGFHTYKNFTVKFYYGKKFKIVPSNYRGYKDLDFKKQFSIQKRYGGVMFTPKDNFLTIPPQEVYVFPMYVTAPKEKDEYRLKIEFNAENTWGMNEIYKRVIVES